MDSRIPSGFNDYYNQPLGQYSQASNRQAPSHDNHYHVGIHHSHTYDTSQSTIFQHPTPRLKPGHGSTSTQSSFTSQRLSSDFSNRNSVASTATTVSRHSNIPEEALTTCVSRRERAKPSDKPAKPVQFWCTACRKSFGSKHDWKTHEEIFQERFEEYWCELDKKTFFSKKDFTNHHYKTHNCRTCVEYGHAEIACRKRKSRLAWGCGFCTWLSTDWNERCDHVASHFRKGVTLDEWKQSQVIWSLLQRLDLLQAWMNLMERKRLQNPVMGWNLHNTGRAEGFPDSERLPQLQDRLEWYTEGQDPYPIIELAIEKGLRHVDHARRSPSQSNTTLDNSSSSLTPVFMRSSNAELLSQATTKRSVTGGGATILQSPPPARHLRRDKALPPDPPTERPMSDPVRAISNDASGIVSWQRFSDTIVPDENLPDSIAMELDHSMHDLGNEKDSWISWLAE